MQDLPIARVDTHDHPVVREGLVALLNHGPEARVVAVAENGEEAAEMFLKVRPEIGLFDLRMPVMDGVEAMISVLKKIPDARIIIATNYESDEDVYRAMRAGAKAYLLKDASRKDFLACIDSVRRGDTWIPPHIGSRPAKRVSDRDLTARELEVMREVVQGKTKQRDRHTPEDQRIDGQGAYDSHTRKAWSFRTDGGNQHRCGARLGSHRLLLQLLTYGGLRASPTGSPAIQGISPYSG